MDIAGVLKHLESLVAFDTQNPPRSLNADAPIFSFIRDVLGPDFDIELTDHCLGRILGDGEAEAGGEVLFEVEFFCHVDLIV